MKAADRKGQRCSVPASSLFSQWGSPGPQGAPARCGHWSPVRIKYRSVLPFTCHSKEAKARAVGKVCSALLVSGLAGEVGHSAVNLGSLRLGHWGQSQSGIMHHSPPTHSGNAKKLLIREVWGSTLAQHKYGKKGRQSRSCFTGVVGASSTGWCPGPRRCRSPWSAGAW